MEKILQFLIIFIFTVGCIATPLLFMGGAVLCVRKFRFLKENKKEQDDLLNYTPANKKFVFIDKEFSNPELFKRTSGVDMMLNRSTRLIYSFPTREVYKKNCYYPCLIHTIHLNGVNVITQGHILIDERMAKDLDLKLEE